MLLKPKNWTIYLKQSKKEKSLNNWDGCNRINNNWGVVQKENI